MTPSFADVKEAIALFSRPQRRELALHLQALGAGSGTAPAQRARPCKGAADDDWLLAGLAWEASRRGKITRPDVRCFDYMSSLPTYRKKAPEARALLLNGFGDGDKPGPRVLATLGRIAARCLFEHLHYIAGVPAGAVLNNVDKIGTAMDAAFPGYIENKLLGVIVRGADAFLGADDE